MCESNIIVKVQQGELRGCTDVTGAGNIYYCFLGIPYAKPPVGPLRFKAPQLPHSWEGVRDATKCGPPSPQINFVKEEYKGNEDCLYLNVYTPQLPRKTQDLKPVYVYLHGGAFSTGNGNKESISPILFMDQDVIFVSPNYRIGAIGFLSTGDGEISGNYGLKDQVMVLRWIQQNIEEFGGDPNNVTLGGTSSGAVCVHLHLLSPMSRGLFHRAILHSGSIYTPWAVTQKPRERAIKFGKALGCSTNSSKRLAEFLMKVPVERLIKNVEKAQDPDEKYRVFPYFRPCVEAKVQDGEEPFLTEDFFELLKKGEFFKVPVLVGRVNREGMYMNQEFILMPDHIKTTNKNFEKLVLDVLSPEHKNKPEKLPAIARVIRRYYFGDKPLSEDTLEEFSIMQTDTQMLYGVHKFIKDHLEHNPQPIYIYMFSFDGGLAYYKPTINLKHMSGVCHMDDMGYIFPNLDADEKYGPDTPEGKVKKNIIKLLTDFIKTGNPTPNEDPSLCIAWNPATKSTMYELNIDADLTLCKNIFKERMELWEGIEKMVSS